MVVVVVVVAATGVPVVVDTDVFAALPHPASAPVPAPATAIAIDVRSAFFIQPVLVQTRTSGEGSGDPGPIGGRSRSSHDKRFGRSRTVHCEPVRASP